MAFVIPFVENQSLISISSCRARFALFIQHKIFTRATSWNILLPDRSLKGNSSISIRIWKSIEILIRFLLDQNLLLNSIIFHIFRTRKKKWCLLCPSFKDNQISVADLESESPGSLSNQTWLWSIPLEPLSKYHINSSVEIELKTSHPSNILIFKIQSTNHLSNLDFAKLIRLFDTLPLIQSKH